MTIPEIPPSHRKAIRCAIVDANHGHGMWQESGVVADAAIATMLALGYRVAPGWVAFSERQPPVYRSVLAYCPENKCTYAVVMDRRIDDYSGEVEHYVCEWGIGAASQRTYTHWCPMPSPPSITTPHHTATDKDANK